MSDPNTDFLAAVGRMAEASGTPTAAPDFETWWRKEYAAYWEFRSSHHRMAKVAWEAAMEAAKNAAMTLAHEREAEIKRLREALTECADSLEAELKHQYDGLLGYPAIRADYDQDMSVVTDARAILAQTPEGK